jgi:hypothetical protein
MNLKSKFLLVFMTISHVFCSYSLEHMVFRKECPLMLLVSGVCINALDLPHIPSHLGSLMLLVTVPKI